MDREHQDADGGDPKGSPPPPSLVWCCDTRDYNCHEIDEWSGKKMKNEEESSKEFFIQSQEYR